MFKINNKFSSAAVFILTMLLNLNSLAWGQSMSDPNSLLKDVIKHALCAQALRANGSYIHNAIIADQVLNYLTIKVDGSLDNVFVMPGKANLEAATLKSESANSVKITFTLSKSALTSYLSKMGIKEPQIKYYIKNYVVQPKLTEDVSGELHSLLPTHAVMLDIDVKVID